MAIGKVFLHSIVKDFLNNVDLSNDTHTHTHTHTHTRQLVLLFQVQMKQLTCMLAVHKAQRLNSFINLKLGYDPCCILWYIQCGVCHKQWLCIYVHQSDTYKCLVWKCMRIDSHFSYLFELVLEADFVWKTQQSWVLSIHGESSEGMQGGGSPWWKI